MSHPHTDGDEPTEVRPPDLAPVTGPSRRPALLIGAGAAVAAVAVVGTLVLWPDDPSIGDSRSRLPPVPEAPPSPSTTPTTASEPTRTSEARRTPRDRTSERPRVPLEPPVPKPPTPTTPTPTPTTTAVPLPPQA